MESRSEKYRLKSTCVTALVLGLLIAGSAAEGQNDPGVVFVPNVVDQFSKLALRPEALAFGIGDSPEPEQCKHYQGLARLQGVGTPYLFVSRSGNEPDGVAGIGCSDSDDPGNLLIVRMGSRDTDGERLRSNRLVRNWDIDSLGWPTPPDPRDTVVEVISFDGQNGWPAYGHPGGLQLVGDVLVVPLETPYQAGDPDNLVLFLDVSDPENPSIMSQFDAGTGSEFSAGLVGVAPVLNEGSECCRYLMLLTGKENKEIRVYRSSPTEPGGTTNLKDQSLSWEYIRSWTEGQIEACLGGVDWHTGKGDAHQMLNFVRQGNIGGPLYLIGGRNTTLLPSGDDHVDLYRFNLGSGGIPEACLLTHLKSTHVTSKPIIGGGDSANFAAASGVFVSPSGEIIIYSTEYENDGPWEFTSSGPGRKTVRFGEWRHREMVRPGSPTLRPAINIGGSFQVDEGGSTTLAAAGSGPTTKAWLQLFEDDDLGLSLPGFGDKDDWLVADYVDWNEDDFDDFRKLHYSDDAGSWRWFAPVGCTMRANDDDFSDSNFPGTYTRTLVGTGFVEEESDLDSVRSDGGDCCMDDEVTSMQFFSNCDAYYSAEIMVHWDLDLDSVFDTYGNAPDFFATGLDGPDTVQVPVRGEHSTDSSHLGDGANAYAEVSVVNVAPVIQSFQAYDSLGQEIGVDVPFAFASLETSVAGTFSDQGEPDTQTASLNWGDGTVHLSGELVQFSDAFGGATGQFRDEHVFADPGSFPIQLDLVDDDGGAVSAVLTVEIVSPLEAVGSIIDEIDALLAAESNRDVAEALLDARDQLDGNNYGKGQNGALDKLEKGNLQAALVKIEAALEDLVSAESLGGGDLGYLKTLLCLVAEAVAQGAYLDAVEAVSPPTPKQQERLDMAAGFISSGHDLVSTGDFLGAIEDFQDAVRKVQGLVR